MDATDDVGIAFHQPYLIINSRHRPVSTTSYAPDPDLTCTALSNWNVTELRDAPTSRAYLHSAFRAAADPLHIQQNINAIFFFCPKIMETKVWLKFENL